MVQPAVVSVFEQFPRPVQAFRNVQGTVCNLAVPSRVADADRIPIAFSIKRICCMDAEGKDIVSRSFTPVRPKRAAVRIRSEKRIRYADDRLGAAPAGAFVVAPVTADLFPAAGEEAVFPVLFVFQDRAVPIGVFGHRSVFKPVALITRSDLFGSPALHIQGFHDWRGKDTIHELFRFVCHCFSPLIHTRFMRFLYEMKMCHIGYIRFHGFRSIALISF